MTVSSPALALNRLYFGDNLPVLRREFADQSIDLIYLDPPFGSQKQYRTRESASGTAYSDIWRWEDEAKKAYKEIQVGGSKTLAGILKALREVYGESGLLAYAVMLAPRLVELRRILKLTGSLYFHCDQRASGIARLLLDGLLGVDAHLSSIVWCYGLGGSSARHWPRKHDEIYWYARQPGQHYFSPPLMPASSQRMKGQVKKIPDYWLISTLNNMARERTGYPTQKPLALLERIVTSSSPPGGVVLDPFCGSGTALVAAVRSGHAFAGIDRSRLAIATTRLRLDSMSPAIDYLYKEYD
ncbi:MAG: site-specific DNA-methyltransferase [Calditrichaeota bacterium]|nr:site-specific DNA-methyltransferase [Calditrichota bacterium]